VKIIGLDPGGTTGWAKLEVVDLDNGSPTMWNFGQIGPEPHHNDLDIFLGQEHVRGGMTIVCEHFDWRPSKQAQVYGDRKVELISREYEGVVHRFHQERARTPNAPVVLVLQQPSEALGFVKDANIKALDLWWPGHKHAMDALRHILYYLVKQGPADIQRAVLEAGWK
jgi:hypothetical protein